VSGYSPGARIVDRYTVVRELGGGGMGVVYLARDEVTTREVAVKVLRQVEAAAAQRTDLARRVRREASATSSLDPSRVAQVIEVGETAAGELFLAMEYVRGKTVRDLLRTGGVPRAEALRIAREISITLGAAHRAGLVHRDVKPDNVIVGEDGRVVLLDFGIVKRTASEDALNLSTQVTTEGVIMGTPAYLAPEQALGRGVGPACDQFALAVMTYELLTGRIPWTSKEVTHVLAQILSEPPPPASSAAPTVPREFDPVFERALAKDPAGRFPHVEAFASALEAAERGEVLASPASQTLGGPLPVRVETAPAVARSVPRPRSWNAVAIATAAVVIAATGGTAGLLLARRRGSSRATSAAPTATVLASADAHLACPIFEAHGAPAIEGWLGAAVATLACGRAKWLLGGRDDRVLPPAALLDVPRQPIDGLADPYSAPEQRARTIDAATKRADAYLDGVVTRAVDGWRVAVSVHARDGHEIARGQGHDANDLPLATKAAMIDVWKAPSLPQPSLDPEVARWTGYPDLRAGLIDLDLVQLGDTRAPCEEVRRLARGPAFAAFEGRCAARGESTDDAGLPAIDESSGTAFAVTTAAAFANRAIKEPVRLAETAERLRAADTSRYGHALLGHRAGMLWLLANQPTRAHAVLLATVEEDPQLLEAWQVLPVVAAENGASTITSAAAAAWFPCEGSFLATAQSIRSDDAAARLRDARLAFLLEPTFAHEIPLARTLAEYGHGDELRALLAEPVEGGTSDALTAFALGLLDLHDAKFARGLQRFDDAAWQGMSDRVVATRALGDIGATATRWAASFLAMPDDAVSSPVRISVAPMIFCAHARGPVASKCLDRIDTIGHAALNWWGEGGDDVLRGARRYAAGDMRGAVAAWRSLVAGPSLDIARLLPTDAFERAGEPDLAARLDERKMEVRILAGVSDAAPRVAKRALAKGDRDRARTIAQQVVSAWEVADTTVPAVAEMRALLRAIDK
jgi:predicted Ser/Thr protein kinase